MGKKKEWTAEEIEDRKERRRLYAYRHFARTRKVGDDSPIRRKRYRSEYNGWVQPLVGEPVQLGPADGEQTIINRRVKVIHKLIAVGNARQFDIDWLYRYENNLPQ